MVKFPEIQKQAQEELDRVVKNRLPEHGDLDAEAVPYFSAILKEVHR
jgi:hypothetical protein